MLNPAFKWKHWYWYCALISNVSTAFFLSLNVVLRKKDIIDSTNSFINWLLFGLFSTFVMLLFLVYVYKTTKETRFCGNLIKPERFKFFQFGCLSYFVMLNVFLILWFLQIKLETDVPIYVAIPLSIIFGLASTILLTIYEFCISFDVFYAKNKTEIVHNFLLKKQKEKKEEEKVEKI